METNKRIDDITGLVSEIMNKCKHFMLKCSLLTLYKSFPNRQCPASSLFLLYHYTRSDCVMSTYVDLRLISVIFFKINVIENTLWDWDKVECQTISLSFWHYCHNWIGLESSPGVLYLRLLLIQRIIPIT